MCVRSRADLSMIDVDMLKRLEPTLNAIQILFSPWSGFLEPAICTLLGLTSDRLVEDGLSKNHVLRLGWPLSCWCILFGLEQRHIETLNIRRLTKYFPNLDADMADNSKRIKAVKRCL